MIQDSFDREDMQEILKDFTDYLRYEKNGGLSEGTIKRYRLNLRCLQAQINKNLLAITQYQEISRAIQGLRAKYHWSRSTTKNCADTASVFFNWASRFQMISVNPMELGHEFKRGELTQMDFFDWESVDFKKLIYNPDNSIQENAIFHTLRSSGLRASPLCKLRFRDPCDVFLEKRFFRIRSDKRGAWHEVNFDEETQKWLRLHLQSLVMHTSLNHLFQRRHFTRPYTPDTLRKLIYRKADRLGIHAYPQKFRRSLGGEMISAGADLTMVKEQLHHKRASTTADYYVRFTTAKKRDNYDRYTPRMTPAAIPAPSPGDFPEATQ